MTADRGFVGRLARVAVLGVLILGIAAAWRWRGLFDPVALQNLIERNPLAPLAFLAIHVAASLFFVPRTLLALAAGLLFGMWWGALWAALGSVAGAVAGFVAARYLNAGFVAEFLEGIDRRRLRVLLDRVEHGGWRMVAMLRLLPVIPHSLTNYALGLTRLGIGAYALGSLLGQLPLTIAYADLGAAGGRALFGAADWPHRVLWPSLIGVTALGLSLLIPVMLRRRMRQAPEA
jgi:uncharacterized membrane protein YdjX (TVP38/TMEM64 family)